MGSANFESGLRPDLLHSKMFSSKTKHHWVSISMELHLIFNYKSFEKIWISNEVLNVSWEGIQWLDGSCVQDLMQIVCGLPQRAISFSYRTFNEDSHTFVNKLEILHQNLISVEFQEIGFLAISIRLILTIFGLFFFQLTKVQKTYRNPRPHFATLFSILRAFFQCFGLKHEPFQRWTGFQRKKPLRKCWKGPDMSAILWQTYSWVEKNESRVVSLCPLMIFSPHMSPSSPMQIHLSPSACKSDVYHDSHLTLVVAWNHFLPLSACESLPPFTTK